MIKRLLLSLLTLLGMACLGLLVIAGSGGLLAARGSFQQSTQPPPVCPTITLQATPLPLRADLPVEIAAQMDEIQQQVIQIRGLHPRYPLRRALLTGQELRQRVEEEFFGDYSPQDAANDVWTLNALGLIEPAYDLYTLYLDLYSEQVAGYYDSKTKEMFVIQGEGFLGPERMTYAHEFVHVLQDQNYDLREGLNLNDEYCRQETEYCSAVRALIEGDAMMSEQSWFFRNASEQDRQEVQQYYQQYQSPVFDSLPEFLKKDFLFPYQQGFEFVQSLYDRGGWAAVNAAFCDPPRTTRQILHPDLYPHVLPQQVTLPDLLPVLGEGWERIEQNVLGEWYIYLLLSSGSEASARLADPEARQAADGWAGDAYALYGSRQSGQTVFIQHTLWETPAEVNEFWQAFQKYGSARWGEFENRQSQSITWENTLDGWVALLRNGKETLWLMAPDAGGGWTILREFSGFKGDR